VNELGSFVYPESEQCPTVREPSLFARILGQALRESARLEARGSLRGFWLVAKLARYLHFQRGLFSADLGPDSRFIFPLGDRYWSKHIIRLANSPYEPEIDWLLRRAANLPYAMLDCGANMGYWAVLASSAAYGQHFVVAIEASRSNFELLLNNAHANRQRFRAVHRAITDISGQTARLIGRPHFGRSLRADWQRKPSSVVEEVETITLDEVADRYLPKRDWPPLIKLDVEGVETEAMKGGHRLIEGGALVIYEDHAKETTHPATRYIMSLRDMEIWNLAADERLARITSLDQLAAIKTNPIAGYNFFTYRRGSPWGKLFSDLDDGAHPLYSR
jgi:FkbM family methyltransferase